MTYGCSSEFRRTILSKRPPGTTMPQFISAVQTTMDVNPSYRRGQAVFNTLFSVWPELATRIMRTELDPFQDDKRVPVLMEWLAEHWFIEP